MLDIKSQLDLYIIMGNLSEQKNDFARSYEYYKKSLMLVTLDKDIDKDIGQLVVKGFIEAGIKLISVSEDGLSKLKEIKDDITSNVVDHQYKALSLAFLDFIALKNIASDLEHNQDLIHEYSINVCKNINAYLLSKQSGSGDGYFETDVVIILNYLRSYINKEAANTTTQFLSGSYEAALNSAKKVIDISEICLDKDPNYAIYLANYGISLLKTDNKLEAIKYISRSLSKSFDNENRSTIEKFESEAIEKIKNTSGLIDLNPIVEDLIDMAENNLKENKLLYAIELARKAQKIISLDQLHENTKEKFSEFITSFKFHVEQDIFLDVNNKNYEAMIFKSKPMAGFLAEIRDEDKAYFDSFIGQAYINLNECSNACPYLASSISKYQADGKQFFVNIIQGWIDGCECAGQISLLLELEQ